MPQRAWLALSFGLSIALLAGCGSKETEAQPQPAERTTACGDETLCPPAIASAELRARGRVGLASAMEAYAEAGSPQSAAWHRWLDDVGGARDTATSGLFWHTDVDAALADAQQRDVPVLSLRMLGDLREELSCANSRFFRTVLYADPELSRWLDANFVLHWSSERAVPVLEIDYGDGRKIRTTTTGKIAGILAEPIQGVGGFITPPDDYWKIVYDIVKKYGGVFIADEVQTGFGRTGKMWGVDGYGIEPDIMTMAKGIANGFALSACLATTDITMSQAGKGPISTYGGNPVSTTAGMAVLDEIENNNLIDNAAQRGGELREALEGLQRKYPKLIGDVRGKGLMQAIELVVDETAQDRTPNPAAVVALFEETKKRKLLIGKGGLNGNVVRISPALNVSADDIKEAVATMDESFAALKSN